VAVRYQVARDHRAALARALTAELVVRVDGRATGRLPGLTASLSLSTPDRVRLRATALLGIGVDVLARGDSLWAWVPSERVAFSAPSDSLGVGPVARLAARALCATWEPPPAAWRNAAGDSAGWTVSWPEGVDSLALTVDRAGLPRALAIARAAVVLRVRYDDWTRVRGEPFPARVQLADDSGWARVRVQIDELRAVHRARADWFEPRRGGAGRRLDWGDLKHYLGREGTP
jgi:hypothetical protein